jgi:hypothetical protein
VKTWLFALLLVGSFACKKKKQEEAQPQPPPQVADAADAPVIDAAPAPEVIDAAAAMTPPTPPEGAIAITEAGVGPLNEKSKTDVKSLKAAFPGFDAKKESIPKGEDLKDEHMAVTKGGKVAMKIYGDGSANSIEVVSDDIWNPWGLKIGMTHEEVAKLVGPFECTDGSESADWKNYIIECDTEKTKNWSFDFQHEGTPAKEVIATPATLAKATLVAMRWTAPDAGSPK